MRTSVMNLATGKEIIFTCPPAEAVVCAFEQHNGNWSTWNYDYSKADISKSGLTVSCGLFVALVNQ
jgi:hypothetical protein